MNISSIYRYPVKGLSADSLSQVLLQKDQGLAFDRFWAIENGVHDFDSDNPRFFPKRRFLQLAQNPKLAQLRCRFDEASQTLTILHNKKQLVSADMASSQGISAIEHCIANFMENDMDGAPRLVSAGGHHFSDIPQKAVSLINLASVREISASVGKTISPLRFRGNIYIDGIEPWAEMNWQGKTLNIAGKPVFEIFDIIGRCPATKVNLHTGERDVEMLDVLNSSFGHTKCGVYMKTITDSLIKTGEKFTLS